MRFGQTNKCELLDIPQQALVIGSKWTTRQYQDAVRALKAQNMQVLVTNLSETQVDFREIDYTKPTAIIVVVKIGSIQSKLELADQDIVIPMVGMVQSLNVSVGRTDSV